MERVQISGSSDTLGLIVADVLGRVGHEVNLHVRNHQRADALVKRFRRTSTSSPANPASIEVSRKVGEQAITLGPSLAAIATEVSDTENFGASKPTISTSVLGRAVTALTLS
jgi:hypothetical protein